MLATNLGVTKRQLFRIEHEVLQKKVASTGITFAVVTHKEPTYFTQLVLSRCPVCRSENGGDGINVSVQHREERYMQDGLHLCECGCVWLVDGKNVKFVWKHDNGVVLPQKKQKGISWRSQR